MLAVAREFAEEWSELRGLHQQKLAGQLLRYVTKDISAQKPALSGLCEV